MESRRLYNKEDRVFTERMKLASLKKPPGSLPKVNRLNTSDAFNSARQNNRPVPLVTVGSNGSDNQEDRVMSTNGGDDIKEISKWEPIALQKQATDNNNIMI